MDYRVETSGRILLPEDREAELVPELAQEVATRSGRLAAGTAVGSLEELAPFAGARAVRDGEWVLLATDRSGQPTWSEQAWAFYAGLAREVRAGDVRLRGVDGVEWSYRYTDQGLVQDDSSASVDAFRAVSSPDTAPPEPLVVPSAEPPVAGSPEPPVAGSPEPPAPDEPVPGWPPPVSTNEAAPAPSAWPPADRQAEPFWRSDEPAPRSTGRTVAMTLLLVLGVLLIVGVAMLAAGLA